ncbi:MAG: hypothetical protein SynsKO_25040 [Synoicihabitans sp.]
MLDPGDHSFSSGVADQDRLQKLRQQRAKIAEHLTWLDEEISREAGNEPPSPRLKLARPPESVRAERSAPTQRESDNPSPAVHADPEAVLEEWTETQSEDSGSGISKSGCWLIFGALVVLGIGSVVAIILIRY